MPKDDSEKHSLEDLLPEGWEKTAGVNSSVLIEKAGDISPNPLLALFSLVLAAARAAGFSGLPCEVLVDTFRVQYGRANDLAIKTLEKEGIKIPPNPNLN